MDQEPTQFQLPPGAGVSLPLEGGASVDASQDSPSVTRAPHSPFRYEDAFSRTVGLVTHEELAILRTRRVAIAGMGGVGGSHLLTLTRLGIGQFNIADFDNFDVVNFNRQAGASVSHLGLPKCKVMADMARDINPTLDIQAFPQGVNKDNIDAFLDGVDVYIDGLDFFAVDIRRTMFAACWEKKIPAVTVAPLGMSAALLNFIPHGITGLKGGLSFEQYFRLEGREREDQYLRFLIGLAPRALHRTHIIDPSSINLAEHRGPSTPMACMLASGVAATEALKILLRRGGVLPAPYGVQFDALGNRLIRTWRPGGMRNPLQQLTLKVARKQMSKVLAQAAQARHAVADQPEPSNQIQQILHLARWAPSGDNTQPWRFEIIDDRHFVIHGRDTRQHCVYDLQGKASQLALGALFETIHIAATGSSMQATITHRAGSPEDKPVFDVMLREDASIKPHPLLAWIPTRVTQRRAMKTTRLTDQQKAALEAAVGPDYSITWFESFSQRLKVAKLLFKSARIRLTIPEAYHVHKHAIQWHVRFSEDRIPDQAVGLDPMALMFMRWAMKSWDRVKFLNRFFAGTVLPRIQLDFLPGMRCGAHAALIAKQQPRTMDDYIAIGRAVQRFWLTSASLGLQFQPQTTPGIFSDYARQELAFSQEPHALPGAHRIRRGLSRLVGEESLDAMVFLARLGQGPRPTSRSTRLSLAKLRQLDHAASPMELSPPSQPAAQEPAREDGPHVVSPTQAEVPPVEYPQ